MWRITYNLFFFFSKTKIKIQTLSAIWNMIFQYLEIRECIVTKRLVNRIHLQWWNIIFIKRKALISYVLRWNIEQKYTYIDSREYLRYCQNVLFTGLNSLTYRPLKFNLWMLIDTSPYIRLRDRFKTKCI